MDKRKSFLDVLVENINVLQEKGIITEQELRKGLQIPTEWLYTSGIDREDIMGAMETICNKVNSKYQTNRKYADKIEKVTVRKNNNQIMMTIEGRDDWTKCNITNEIDDSSKIKCITVEQLVKEIYAKKLQNKMKKLCESLYITEDEARQIITQVFDGTQKTNDLYGLAESLCEMSENFTKYYEYMHEQANRVKEEQEKNTAIPIIDAGIVIVNRDSKEEKEGQGNSTRPNKPKQNDNYPYEQRDKILQAQKPILLVACGGKEVGEDSPNPYMSYIYNNPRDNEGYLLVIEPINGDRDGRIIYLPSDIIEVCQNQEEINEMWKRKAREYIQLSRREFYNEENTASYYHTSIEAFEEKFEYILSDKKQKNSSVISTANRTLRKLFGTEVQENQLADIAKGVSLRAMEIARKTTLGIGDKSRDNQK